MRKRLAGLIGLSEITGKIHRGTVMRKMTARSLADLVQGRGARRPYILRFDQPL
jgi:FixJ family two-component response regulator